jgi:hypothetical protein
MGIDMCTFTVGAMSAAMVIGYRINRINVTRVSVHIEELHEGRQVKAGERHIHTIHKYIHTMTLHLLCVLNSKVRLQQSLHGASAPSAMIALLSQYYHLACMPESPKQLNTVQ